jgi:hypothetical protein
MNRALPTLTDIAGLSGKARWNTKMQSHEVSGPCPFGCGVRTAFHVYPDMNEVPGIGYLGYFLCMDSNKGGRAGCGRSGNMIDLVMQRDHLDFDQACTMLGIDPQALRISRKDQKVRQLMEEQPGLSFENACRQVSIRPEELGAYREKAVIPTSSNRSRYWRNHAPLAETSEEWRINAYALTRISHAKLRIDERTKAYLYGREIVDEIMRENHYGLYDQYKWVNAALWGYRQGKGERPKRMVIPRGIVIPWMDSDYTVRCIRVRRLPWDESDEARRCYGVDPKGEIGRYTTLYGVSTKRLYNDHRITPGCKVALFEGEFTSVVAQAACKESRIVCVATGSTAWGWNSKNLRLLASCEKVLICFDADTNRAGDKASKRWLDRLSNAVRWRPLWNDANAMAMDGIDVGEWLALGFEESTQKDQGRSHQVAAGVPVSSRLSVERCQEQSGTAPLCTVCQRAAEHFTMQGQPYCQSHYERLPLYLRCDALAVAAKEAALWALREQFQRDYLGKALPDELLRVAANFPGWSVSVEPRLIGTSHVKQMEET